MTGYFIPVTGPHLGRRIVQLVIGLVLFGIGIGLMLQSGLGVPPWDVLHQGLAHRFGLTVGIWSIIVSVAVLLLWLPLRQPYGLGTLLNALIIGAMIDATSAVIPAADATLTRWVMLLAGISMIGFASGLYIGAGLGPGPRDGLMTGIARRGPSIRLTRSVIEVVVLAIGWALGGTFGIGTVIFALAIGPLVQLSLTRFSVASEAVTEDVRDHPAR
jgi:uncharacterized membrane protein YczE